MEAEIYTETSGERKWRQKFIPKLREKKNAGRNLYRNVGRKKMEVEIDTETSRDMYQTTRCHVP